PVNNKIEVGVMIETPSAVMIADVLAWEADFFSIGTNDLIQYTLACERGNERVAYLYNPLHPAILRSIKMTIDAGHRQGKWVGMCGEMAGNPLFTVLLLGLGLDGFSMAGIVVPEIKEIIREITIEEAIGLACQTLSLGDVKEVENLIYARLTSRFGRIFEMMGEKR
ncbi:phosphoenolpyruvate--protein phosphotransferase, partial [bacterium]|nr:phosphoenolpyruvate--protein phosphotransferase [bacterium]